MLVKGFLGAGLAASAASAATPLSQTSCTNLTFVTRILAPSRQVPPPPDLSPPGAVESYILTLTQQYLNATIATQFGRYTLAATYCPPQVPPTPGDAAPLQILAHGSSYTKEYWDRGAWGTGALENSWVYYATSQGYATLAVDRLCNGDSEHPDSVNDCQLPANIETFHSLIQQIRNGSTPVPVPSNITFVAHSAGSTLAANLAQNHPDDFESLVLTGFPAGSIAASGVKTYYAEHNMTPPPSPFLAQDPRPAAVFDPARFHGLDTAYIISTNPQARTAFYSGDYDPQIVTLDYDSRGSVPLGENTWSFGMMSFPRFTGQVLVATGDLDDAAWGDRDVVWRTGKRFPAATNFNWIHVPDCGHSVDWHRGAPQMFEDVHDRLRDAGRRAAQQSSSRSRLRRRRRMGPTRGGTFTGP